MREADLYYLAGVIAGDGHLEKNKPRIVIGWTKKQFLLSIKRRTKIKGSIFLDKSAGVWKFAINSKDLYNQMQEKFNIPVGKKSARIKPPKKYNIDYIRYYIAGWFDTDGNVEDNNGSLRIRLRIKSRAIRDFVSKQLNNIGIETRIHDRSDLRYTVEINKKSDVNKFLRLIPTTVGG